jgi:hypothetical protein
MAQIIYVFQPASAGFVPGFNQQQHPLSEDRSRSPAEAG